MHLRTLVLGAVTTTFILIGSACANPSFPVEDTPEVQTLPIVNGEEESGYPAVGTLVQTVLGLRASFCTGTLIAPNWVVTAAHCVKGQNASLVGFYVGKDGNGFGGTVYPAEKLLFHPRYTDDTNPGAVLYDIGLVRLSKAVPANVAKPYPYNRQDLKKDKGRTVTFVGYGATSAPKQQATGAGTKRRTTVKIDRVDDLTYSLKFEDTGVCFGDSGGPGLSDFDGETRVISVVSTGNGCAGPDCDPCREAGSNHTRVDAFADWIAANLGDDFPRCNEDLSRCECPQACGADGVCDNAACKSRSCGEALRCVLDDCDNGEDGSCSQACLQPLSPEGEKRIAALFTCWSEKCKDEVGAEADACTDANCLEERAVCEEKAGAKLCDAVDACVLSCKNEACKKACLLDGTIDAQESEPPLDACRTAKCKGKVDAELRVCAQSKCGAEFNACHPPDHCSPVAGACPDGQACVPAGKDATRCVPSAGKEDGESCDPAAAAVECADGLHCRESGNSGVCVAVCKSDADCAERCDVGAYGQDKALGLCQPKARAKDDGCAVRAPGQPARPWSFMASGLVSVALIGFLRARRGRQKTIRPK